MNRIFRMVGIIVLSIIVVILLFLGGYWYKSCPLPCPEVKKEVIKKPVAVIKKSVAKSQVKQKTRLSEPARVTVPASAPVTRFALRINIVEWSEDFRGKSLMSRDIGPIIRQGLANGTVVRTKAPITFDVNGAAVPVNDGQAIVDPGPIGPETALVVQPVCGAKFASPPSDLPLTTNPGELYALTKRGVSEVWLNFILADPDP